MSVHTSLCLDARSYHSISKETVLSLLPAHISEIFCDQDSPWIEVLPQNLHTEWLWLWADSAVVNHVVGSISVYSNLLVYEQSVYKFLLNNFGTNSCSQCLFWDGIGHQIFSNAQNTMTSYSCLCRDSNITVFSFFLGGLLWSFVLIIFSVYILTHWGRVTQICVITLQLCKTDDANLRF